MILVLFCRTAEGGDIFSSKLFFERWGNRKAEKVRVEIKGVSSEWWVVSRRRERASGGPAGGRTFEKFDKQVGRAKSKSCFSHRWHGWVQMKILIIGVRVFYHRRSVGTPPLFTIVCSLLTHFGSWFEGFASLMAFKVKGWREICLRRPCRGPNFWKVR